jgi:hypothetical protein
MNVGRFRLKGVAELASYLETFFNILQAIARKEEPNYVDLSLRDST